ncbi:hypothetical protein N0V90_006582 [Kalmusia sp. IMI 367209]|nr:hypothetical protein N0V90_006582 [Kalmusia sp. IMI 367209]
MAPIPANDQPADQPSSKPEEKSSQGWSTPTIVVGAVFLFLLVAFIITLVAFYFHKRSLRKKLPAEHRSKPYRPFRTESTDKSALLADVKTPDEERSSMFSRERSSVSLYVDAEPVDKRASMETVSLIPLHVTPAERQDSLTGQISNGSGVSGVLKRKHKPEPDTTRRWRPGNETDATTQYEHIEYEILWKELAR